jgi:hypothetical protein
MSRGALMILANIGPDDEAEFNSWYDREHMRERMEVPGFISAQRYVSNGASRWKYLALYETEALSTFSSPIYREALANQSAWSKQILARFRDPQRSVAERTCRIGYGLGGTLTLARIRPKPGSADALRRSLSEMTLPGLAARPGVIEARLIECDPVLSKPVAEYPKGGLDVIRPDDWFVLVGGTGATETAIDIPGDLPADLAETVERIGTFSLLWDLHRSEL